jgi:Protease inhibitor Inh
MTRFALICLAAIWSVSAVAQAPALLGDSAKAVVGTWEFSNADRDKICSVTFKSDLTAGGMKVEFDKACSELFPLIKNVAAWNFPDNDLLHLLDSHGKALIEFSEVEDGIYEAPTPGVGVLFLQNAATAGPPPRPPGEIAGTWSIMRGEGAALCTLTLATMPVRDDLALTVKPGCDPTIARLNFLTWRIDRGELLLVPARGSPWRFEEIDTVTWHRLPETADEITLVRQ